MKIKINNIQASSEARGKRVEILRGITRLSRRGFRERYGIAQGSLQNWEDARGGGLTEKGARKLIKVIKMDGILCNFEWLMYGVGQPPLITGATGCIPAPEENSAVKKNSENIEIKSEQDLIATELLAFHQNYPKTAVDFVVADDGMEPRFVKGEFVAGCRRHGNIIEKFVGLDCIVQTNKGDVLLRTIKKVEPNGHFTLACLNPSTSVEKPILYDVELLTAAPIIWARRKNPAT